MQEDLNFQIKFFEELIRDDPDYVDALIPLGDAYTKMGFYQNGLGVDLKLTSLKPEDPSVFYNLACSYALMKKQSEALLALEKALKLGYHDLAWMEGDSDLAGIRNLPQYRKLVRKYFPAPPVKSDGRDQ